jgi:hypothetical protein
MAHSLPPPSRAAAEARVLLQLDAPLDDAPELKSLSCTNIPDHDDACKDVPVLELPARPTSLLRNDTGCSKWSEASETQWRPVLDLGGLSAFGSSDSGASPRSADSEKLSPTSSQGQDRNAAAVVLELPASGRALLRNDTGCSKWSEASETQWQPVLELPPCRWSEEASAAGSSSTGGGSPRSSADLPAPQPSPAGIPTHGNPGVAGAKPQQQQQQQQQHGQQLPVSESAPAAMLQRSSHMQPPIVLGARLGSAPVGGLPPGLAESRSLRAGQRMLPQLSSAQLLKMPQSSVQLRSSSRRLIRQDSRHVLRLLAHAYSELVGT